MPERDLARLTSEALIEPLALMSVRKFVAVTVAPDCALICETSEALTDLLPVESPESTFMLTIVSANVCACVSVTPLSLTLIFCALVTPVRFTVIVFAENVGLPATLPMPEITLALPLMRLLSKVKTRA